MLVLFWERGRSAGSYGVKNPFAALANRMFAVP